MEALLQQRGEALKAPAHPLGLLEELPHRRAEGASGPALVVYTRVVLQIAAACLDEITRYPLVHLGRQHRRPVFIHSFADQVVRNGAIEQETPLATDAGVESPRAPEALGVQ